MTTNNIKHYLLGLCIGCGSVALLPACSDWDDHYEDSASEASSVPTLWQTMQQYPELSDFREVLSKTMVFKHHKKTNVSYASLLDGAQTFTVLAPVNGSFNKDSVLDLLTTNKGDSMVVRSFIGNHLSYNLAVNVDTLSEFFLLNSKRVTIGYNHVLDTPIKKANVKAKGGILHIMQGKIPYRQNLYEAMLNDTCYSLIGEQLSSYEQDEFSPTESVEGGMVDGEQIYVDSVFNERNLLLEYIGEIAAEDSSFLFVVPTTEEWKRVWNEAMSYYRYDATVENGDSLQRFWANYALLNDAVFSNTIQAKPKDSLITYLYNKRYPKYHVFHKPYEPGGILYDTKTMECSNGTLFTTEHWPYTPQTTYQRELKTEGERTGLILNYNLCTYSTRVHAADSVSEKAYLVITPQAATSNWTMTFKLENTLAGAYDICAVILPSTVYSQETTPKPCRFQAEIGYVDVEGNEKTFNCGNTKFSNKAYQVDTVVLAQDFVFPVCNYNQTNMKFTVKLKCNMLPRENTNYSREMFLDCIYLRPKKIINTDK